MLKRIFILFIYVFSLIQSADNKSRRVKRKTLPLIKKERSRFDLTRLSHDAHEAAEFNHFDCKLYFHIKEAFLCAHNVSVPSFEYQFQDGVVFSKQEKKGIRHNHTAMILACMSYRQMIDDLALSHKSKKQLRSLLSIYKDHLRQAYFRLDSYDYFQRYVRRILKQKPFEFEKWPEDLRRVQIDGFMRLATENFENYMHNKDIVDALRCNITCYERKIEAIDALVKQKKVKISSKRKRRSKKRKKRM